MATIKGFIFDLDGVLVNTTQYHFEAWKRVAQELDFSFREKDYEEVKGLARKEALQKLLEIGKKEISQDRFEELLRRKNEWYLGLIESLNEDDVLPGVVEFLKNSQNLNLRIGIGTVSRNSGVVLERSGLEDFFEVVISGNDIAESKPNPEVFLKAADQLELEASEVIIFEDSKAGIEAAGRGGFRSVGIGKKKILSEADLVLKDLEAVKPAEVINQLNF